MEDSCSLNTQRLINNSADNDTSVDSTPVNENDETTELFFIIGHYFQCTIALATFLYVVISWCLIKKFRTFNNYVYLSAILVNILRLAVGTVTLMQGGLYYLKGVKNINLYFYIFMFLSAVYNYWLVVMGYMFYVDIVKVFHTEIKKKYLKSSLFAWGVPLMLVVISRSIFMLVELADESHTEERLDAAARASIRIISNVFPTIINSVLYVKLVYALFSCNDPIRAIIPKKERIKQNVSRFCIATAMFVLNNIFVLITLLAKCSKIVRALSFFLQVVVLSLFVPLLKSNRVVWHEYYKNRLKRIRADSVRVPSFSTSASSDDFFNVNWF